MDFSVRKSEGKDSHFSCFFCNRRDIESNSSVKLSLSKIFNYLQLFPHDGKRKKLCYPSDTRLETMSICKHCSEMAMEFSEHYHLLEVTELRLSRCLDQMQEVMTKAEDEISKPIDKEDSELRTSVIGRIKEISNFSPVSLRSRSQIMPTSTVLDEYYNSMPKDRNRPPEALNATNLFPLPEDETDCHDNKPKVDSITGSECEQGKISARKRTKKRKITGTPTKMDSPQSPSTKKSKGAPKTCKFCSKTFQHSNSAQRHMKYFCKNKEDSDSLLSCAYCTYECTNHQDYMNDHLIRRHPEMFFQSEKNNSSSSWKQEHFRSIVKEIVFAKFIFRKNASLSSCSCSVCGKKCSSDKAFSHNRSKLTIHLIKAHIQKLREYLKDVLENKSDESLQNKIRKALSLRKPSNRWKM